jgi:hypothetical protein
MKLLNPSYLIFLSSFSFTEIRVHNQNDQTQLGGDNSEEAFGPEKAQYLRKSATSSHK